MPARTAQGGGSDYVIQFSVFTPNRMGRLHELITVLGSKQVHVLALTILDTTDSAIIRFAVDDPDRARELMHDHGFPFNETPLVVVEMDSVTELARLMSSLLEAELNINYMYSFIPHAEGKSLLALNMEDNDMAEQVLKQHQFHILRQSDISR